MKSSFFATLISYSLLLSSCGLGFNFKKKITGQYYLLAVDTKDQLDIAYRDGNSESYSGRIPPTVIEFGFSDSLLVGKTIDHSGIYYYIINMNRDGEMARKEQYLIGPISEAEYFKEWSPKLNIKLTKVKDIDSRMD